MSYQATNLICQTILYGTLIITGGAIVTNLIELFKKEGK